LPKIIKIPLIILAVFSGLILIFLGITQTSWFKNKIKTHLITYCEEELEIKVSINTLDINYFDFIRLNNLYIEGKNSDTLIYADQLSVDYDLKNLVQNKIELDRVLLEGGVINIGIPKNENSLNIQFLIDALKPENQKPSKQSLPFTISNIKLENTNFYYFDDNYDSNNSNLFDQNHIKCNAINGELSDFLIIGDSLEFAIDRLSTHENSGLVIEKLSANTTISSTTIKFENLTLKTPSSFVENYVAFKYKNYHDFSDFNNRVTINFSLLNSYVHTKDISYFSDNLNSFDELLKINGIITGKVNDLKSENLQLSVGNYSHFDGQFVVKNITNASKSNFIINAKKIESTPDELERHLGENQLFRELDYLKKLQFIGKFKGGIHDFDIDGKLVTNVGNVTTNFSVSNIDDIPTYQGSLSSKKLNLGQILSNPSFEYCNFNIDLNGQGSSLEHLKTKFKGAINQISYNGILYDNTILDGSIMNSLISCKINNQSLENAFVIDATLDLQEEKTSLNAKTDIQKLNFRLSPDDTTSITLTCNGNFNLTGNSIEELNGEIDLEHLKYSTNHEHYPFNHFKITKKATEDNQDIKLISDEFELHISGNYTPDELPTIAQKLIHNIQQKDQLLIDSTILSKNVNVIVKVSENNQVISQFIENLSLESGFFSLNYDIENGNISSNHNIIGLHFKNITAPHIIANIQNERDSSALNFSVSTGGLLQNDSSLFDLFELKGTFKNNVVHFSNLSKKGNNLEIDIEGRAIFSKDSTKIHFDQSKVQIEQKPWVLKPVDNPNIVLHDGITEFLYFDFRHADEILFVDASLGDNSSNKANAIISNFKLENINPFIAGFDLRFHGLVNGFIDISNRDGFPIIETNLSVNQFQMDDDTLGDLEIISENAAGLAVKVNGNISNGILNQMKIKGDIDFENKKSPLNLRLETQRSSIKPFEKYLAGLMSDVSGYSTTDISITGPLKSPKLDGTMHLDSLRFKMEYLQTNYTADATVKIDYSSFHISDAKIVDRYGQKGSISGDVNHRNFHDFKLDLNINDLENFEIMNTLRSDNNLFYGSAFMDGSANISGPVDDIYIQVNAKSRKGTVIEIPLDDIESDHTLSYVKFVDPQKKANEEQTFKTSTGIQMDFNFEITNDAEVKLIFDELLGDKIEASSHGNLRMEINTFGDFNMYGGLTVDKGNYLFTAFDLINKFFIVNPGGTLRWDGNPYNAKINLEAIKREYPIPLPLLAGSLSSTEDSTLFQTAIPADCYLKLEGLLFNPDVTFDLGFPSQTNLNTNTNSTLNTVINRIRLDQEELNRQVFALLVLGTFIPPSFANTSSPELSVGAVNTGINSFSDFASSQINNWLGQLDTRFQLGVDYQTSYQKKAELILSLRRKFLNDRLELSYSTDAAAQGSIPYDISVKYTIGDDGNLKLQGFQKQANDPTIGSITNVRTTGVGLFYRYPFDKFRLRRRKKKISTNP
jgi:hypothetical protein